MISNEEMCNIVRGAAMMTGRPQLYWIDLKTSKLLPGLDDYFFVSVFDNNTVKVEREFRDNIGNLLATTRELDIKGIENATCMMDGKEHAYIGLPIDINPNVKKDDDDEDIIDAEIEEVIEK